MTLVSFKSNCDYETEVLGFRAALNIVVITDSLIHPLIYKALQR